MTFYNMSETKTYVFPDGNGSGVDANLLAAMNGGFGGKTFPYAKRYLCDCCRQKQQQ